VSAVTDAGPLLRLSAWVVVNTKVTRALLRRLSSAQVFELVA
jgi:hypothetical protein